MAKKVVLVSDLTGNEIEDGKAAKVRITYADARRGIVELDVNADEVDDLARRREKVARRGRRPRSDGAAS